MSSPKVVSIQQKKTENYTIKQAQLRSIEQLEYVISMLQERLHNDRANIAFLVALGWTIEPGPLSSVIVDKICSGG